MNQPIQLPCDITLRPASGAIRKASAWFISGTAPGVWLEEMLRWDVPLHEAKLYVLRTSETRPSACGVLVALPGTLTPTSTPRGVPFGCEANKIWLPVNAILSPPLMPEEMLIHFPQKQYVWHPGIGLTGFDAFEILSVSALLERPRPVESRWNFAIAAGEINHRIHSIRSSISLEDISIFGEEEKSIGNDPVKPKPTLTSGNKSGKSLTNTISKGISNFLRRIATSAKPAPNAQPAKGNAGGNGVPAFYQRLSQKLADWLENRRFKAISQLVKDLEQNPDEALRRAIPFSSAGDHRGLSAPSSELGNRNTDFDLRKLGGGRPADRWDIPNEYRLKLQARYRELALREKRQGKHRRAAYIYAHLLGDFASAAAALMEGHHFMEAAALYKDHLKQPKVAAECLEKGGLYLEAATLYKKQELWEKAAEIFDRLEMRGEALECYQQAVDHHIRNGQFPAAAVLLESKMDQPKAALALLRNGWPDAPTAAACLLGEFDFLARHSMPEASRERLLSLPETPSHLGEMFAKLVTGLARSFPDEETRKIARRISYQRISMLLSSERPALMQQAGTLLQTLSPHDRLLARDAMRYQSEIQLKQRQEKALLAAAFEQKPPQTVGTLLVSTFAAQKLTPPDSGWLNLGALSAGDNLFILRKKAEKLKLRRHSWNTPKFYQEATWIGTAHDFGAASSRDLAMFVLGPKQKLLVYHPWINGGDSHSFPETDKLISSFQAEKPSWATNCIAISPTSMGWVSIRAYPEITLLLTYHDVEGNVIGEYPFPEVEIEGELAWPIIAAHHDHVFIGLGKTLLVHNRKEFSYTALTQQIHRLTTSSPFSTPVCLISMEFGAALYWPRTERMVEIDRDLASPSVGFTTAGHAVAVDGNTMIVCRAAQESIRFFNKQGWKNAAPLAVVSGPSPNDFAVVTSENDFLQFRVS